jgi:hypothetical protein
LIWSNAGFAQDRYRAEPANGWPGGETSGGSTMKRLAAFGLAAALAVTGLTAATETASARVIFGFGFSQGYPGYYPGYSYQPYGLYPRPYFARPYDYDDYYPRNYRVYRHVGSNHVQRCLARYRTYNPATDLYFMYPGVQARCRL